MKNLFDKISPLLSEIEKPSRYIGGELGANNTSTDFCMVYPDIYDIGQSNQAVRILCNRTGGQRSFLPEVDALKVFRDNNIPMFSLETFTPLSDFLAVGITISHELLATNLIETLDFANIPIRTIDRGEDDPYVFGGGPMCCNPEPYHAFFDAITIGEGEEATVNALKKLKELRDLPRKKVLEELAKLPSIYVPSLKNNVKRAVFKDFDKSPAMENCIVPFAQIAHDRLNIEVLRGCARGCRFCQAGFMYRPIRERSKNNIIESIDQGLSETGYNEVSLTSLSTTDHSQIKDILHELNEKYEKSGIRISIPSQRLDSFGMDMAKLIAGNKRGGLTFAPEAGTQRLRDVINKNVTEDNLLDAVRYALDNGWKHAKLYFMIGLPTENDEDLLGIIDLCNKVRGLGMQISVSVAVFVPKALTPFMWDGAITPKEALRRIEILRKNKINISWHDPWSSFIESVLSRGGRQCADLIELAWRYGSKFDAWREHFDFDAWQKAADELNINLEDIACRTYEPGTSMPWSHIDMGVDENYFVSERLKADKAITTSDCTFDKCSDCGVCKNLGCRNVLQQSR